MQGLSIPYAFNRLLWLGGDRKGRSDSCIVDLNGGLGARSSGIRWMVGPSRAEFQASGGCALNSSYPSTSDSYLQWVLLLAARGRRERALRGQGDWRRLHSRSQQVRAG